MFKSTKIVITGALLGVASLAAGADAAQTAPMYPFAPAAAPYGVPFDAKAGYEFHQAMLEQQEKVFAEQRRIAEEMAQRARDWTPAAAQPFQGPFAQSPDQIFSQMKAEHERMLSQIEEQRKQAQAYAEQARAAAPVAPAAYPFADQATPFAPMMDPAQAQARFDDIRKQMESQRAEMMKWAEQQRKAAEEQQASMRKEMETFRSVRKI